MKPIKILFSMVLAIALMSFSTSDTASTLSVDTSKSTAKWKGYHLAKSYAHWGGISLKSGNLEISNGEITGGSFVIDMNSITVEDIKEEKDNAKLVGHLKSEDFFHVEEFPEASLVLTNVTKNGDNLEATGDLTIRGIKNEITFPITVEKISDNAVKATAKLSIDRTVHKVSYGWTIENAVLSNIFDLEVSIEASL